MRMLKETLDFAVIVTLGSFCLYFLGAAIVYTFL